MQIIKRTIDGSFVIDKNGLPYHVPNEGEFADEWAEINAYAEAHPEEVILEEPYVKKSRKPRNRTQYDSQTPSSKPSPARASYRPRASQPRNSPFSPKPNSSPSGRRTRHTRRADASSTKA